VTESPVLGKVHELWGWVDADLAGDTDTRRSHTGYILMMNGGPFSLNSRFFFLCLLLKPNLLLKQSRAKGPLSS